MHLTKCIYLDDEVFIETSHHAGIKKILISSVDVLSALTQMAYGKLSPGEHIEEHYHDSMEEFFYFLKGYGTYIVNETEIIIRPNTCIYIPPQTKDQLICNGNESLEFVYFGISTK